MAGFNLNEEDRGPKCPSCNNTAIKLFSLRDDGTGTKVCRACKRTYKARESMAIAAVANIFEGL